MAWEFSVFAVAEPFHWKTKSAICAVLTATFVFVLAATRWGWLKNALRKNLRFRLVFFLVDPFFALILSALASYFDIFKPSTYSETATPLPDWHTIFWACVWSFLAAVYVVVKFAAVAHKEDEQTRSTALETDLEKERSAVVALQKQRDLLNLILNFIRRTIGFKEDRLLELAKEQKITHSCLVDALSPQRQLHLIRDLIFEFFYKRETSGQNHKLRLGLYQLDPKRAGQFDIVMAWDGATDSCFSRKPQNQKYLNLLDPEGVQSKIVQAYQSPADTIVLVQDCEAEEKQGTFRYWYPEQKQHLKSMLAYKHVFSNRADAIVLMMTSSMNSFFREENAEEFRLFLKEMLTRLEMEWILLEASKRIDPIEGGAK